MKIKIPARSNNLAISQDRNIFDKPSNHPKILIKITTTMKKTITATSNNNEENNICLK